MPSCSTSSPNRHRKCRARVQSSSSPRSSAAPARARRHLTGQSEWPPPAKQQRFSQSRLAGVRVRDDRKSSTACGLGGGVGGHQVSDESEAARLRHWTAGFQPAVGASAPECPLEAGGPHVSRRESTGSCKKWRPSRSSGSHVGSSISPRAVCGRTHPRRPQHRPASWRTNRSQIRSPSPFARRS